MRTVGRMALEDAPQFSDCRCVRYVGKVRATTEPGQVGHDGFHTGREKGAHGLPHPAAYPSTMEHQNRLITLTRIYVHLAILAALDGSVRARAAAELSA
ncbi:hypothetical protein GCM10009758_24200 [Microbacterium hatanonis]